MKYHPSCAIGGTAIETLDNKAYEAMRALRAAKDALVDARPNGRDYLDIGAAEEEFKVLVAGVSAAINAMVERLEYLADKRDERIAQRS